MKAADSVKINHRIFKKKIGNLIIWQRIFRILDNFFLVYWIVRNLIYFLILLRYIPVRWFCRSTSTRGICCLRHIHKIAKSDC